MKGFVFTLFFLAFFTLFLGLVSFYAGSVKNFDTLIIESRAVDRASFAADDVATDLRNFIGVNRITLERNSTNTQLVIRASLPAPFTDPATELTLYRSFLATTYYQQFHSNVSVGTLGNRITFPGLGANYSWNNESRNNVMLSDGNATAYSITGTLNQRCSPTNCNAGATGWNWDTCGANTVSLSIDIRDSSNTQVTVKNQISGCVLKTDSDVFTVSTDGPATLTVMAGTVAGFSPAVNFTVSGPLIFTYDLASNYSTSSVTRAVLPASISVDGRSYSNLVLLEK